MFTEYEVIIKQDGLLVLIKDVNVQLKMVRKYRYVLFLWKWLK